MLFVFQIDFWSDGELKKVVLGQDKYDNLRQGEYDVPWWARLMQFTGLKDKKGKEIYEGDILQDKKAPIKGCDEIGEVIFQNGKFQLKVLMVGKKGYNYFDLINCIDDFEIIGNVYENPELLNQ